MDLRDGTSVTVIATRAVDEWEVIRSGERSLTVAVPWREFWGEIMAAMADPSESVWRQYGRLVGRALVAAERSLRA